VGAVRRRDNFVVIYELLDEMMDSGYPQTTDTKILREYITQESHALDVQARPPVVVTNAVSWQSEGMAPQESGHARATKQLVLEQTKAIGPAQGLGLWPPQEECHARATKQLVLEHTKAIGPAPGELGGWPPAIRS
jgi:hypothetical protein